MSKCEQLARKVTKGQTIITKEPKNQETVLFSLKGIPPPLNKPTPTPAPDHPLEGHEPGKNHLEKKMHHLLEEGEPPGGRR